MVSTGPMPNAIEAEFHISMQAALSACGSPWPPHSAGAARPVPAGGGPAAIGLLPAGRHGDGAVLERRAVLVADGVERRDHVGREPAGFFQHGIDIVGGEIAALRERPRKPGAVLEREGDVGDRRAVGHAECKPRSISAIADGGSALMHFLPILADSATRKAPKLASSS